MLILFAIRLLIFNFLYSFAVGAICFIVTIPFIKLLTNDARRLPTPVIVTACIFGAVVCAIHGVVVGDAVHLSLLQNPDAWRWLWYLVGYMFAAPIAILRSLADPAQSIYSVHGVTVSLAAYVITCAFPGVSRGIVHQLASGLAVG